MDSLLKLASPSGQAWSSSVCFAFLFKFLHYVRCTLDTLPEGAILVAERQPNSYEFKFAVVHSGDMAGQKAHRVISDEFKVALI